jgi:hypothetical protein
MPRTLAENATYIANTIKPAIKQAIEDKGVTVPSTDSFLDYADRIGEISGGGSGYQLKDLPTGSISTVTDAEPLPLNALKVSVEAVQDLHGYDHQWVGGAGKNKLEITTTTQTVNGITFTVNKDSANNVISVTVSGTASATIYFQLSSTVKNLPANSYRLNGCPNISSLSNQIFLVVTGTGVSTAVDAGKGSSFTLTDTVSNLMCYIQIGNGAIITTPITFYPMIRLATESDPTFEPYSNICPIEGWDSGEVTVCDDIQSPTQTETYTQQFPQTIYGAEWNVVDGELKVTDGYIASYNGETLPSTWISDRDVYASGTTPTIGAEVVYKLATPTTIPQQAESIRMLQGVNNLYADCGEVIEGEYFVDEGAIDVRKVDYTATTSDYPAITKGRCFSPKYINNMNYVITPRASDGTWLDVDWTKDFEIQAAFKMLDDSAQLSLFTNGVSNTNNEYSPTIFYTSNNLRVLISSGGGSWDLIYDTNFKPTLDTWYAVKMTYTASTQALVVAISTDFENWTTLMSQTLGFTIQYNGASLIFGGRGADTQYWNPGNIVFDTFNTYIKGDGVSWGAFTGVFPN